MLAEVASIERIKVKDGPIIGSFIKRQSNQECYIVLGKQARLEKVLLKSEVSQSLGRVLEKQILYFNWKASRG